MADTSASGPSVLGMALRHPLNILLLGAVGVSALLTGSWLPLAVGAGAELLWLSVGTRLGGSRDYFDFMKRQHRVASRDRSLQAQLSQLSEDDRRRFLELDRVRGDIRELVARSGDVEQSMLEPELAKVDTLVEAFLDLAARSARYTEFVEGSDLDELEAETRRQEAVVQRAPDPEAKSLAAENLEVLQARLQRAAEVSRLLKAARGQLNLVDNTLRLMRDQVASMQSPSEIRGQLDDLVQSVKVIETSAKETRALEAHASRIPEG